ncbi:unnamed protein product [Macrosiphum euphorbiae]|uniref:Uncharacterized protein n=1 Tax=Macrosiphum euphorbiae TaxID=13131 RepID=A0AAV0VSQ7_9HEMI|nr:unnamed protein product [Macrosiphum euphorbiae]
MYTLKALTETLEKKNLSLVDAATLIDTTIQVLEEINSNTNSMNNLIDSAISFSTTLGINPENDFKIHHRHKNPPTWLDKNSKTQMKHILSLTKTVCDLALTAPVSVATNERTFKKDVADKLNLSNIVNDWASLKNRRIQLL